MTLIWGSIYLISESRETGERIGTCSFIPGEDGKTYDLAYCVYRDYWKQGYATEMAQGMMDYAREHGAHRFTVSVNKENAASNAVLCVSWENGRHGCVQSAGKGYSDQACVRL